jgi:hypothetical protein
MDLRELVRHRFTLVKIRTKMKNKIHSIILMKDVRITGGIHPFTRKHIEKLKEVKDYRIDGYLRMIESLDSEINDVSRKIKTCVNENDIARLYLMPIRIFCWMRIHRGFEANILSSTSWCVFFVLPIEVVYWSRILLPICVSSYIFILSRITSFRYLFSLAFLT